MEISGHTSRTNMKDADTTVSWLNSKSTDIAAINKKTTAVLIKKTLFKGKIVRGIHPRLHKSTEKLHVLYPRPSTDGPYRHTCRQNFEQLCMNFANNEIKLRIRASVWFKLSVLEQNQSWMLNLGQQ